MTKLSFAVTAWSAWAPGLESAAAWLHWAGQTEQTAVTADTVTPSLLRRRVSPLGQQALKAAWALPDVAVAPMVFCSRHGEFGRTLSILDSLVSRAEVSPADFTLSVHNALAGLLSIAGANRQGHTMIAAGAESFGFGMLEALARLAERPDVPVLLVHFDERLPVPFDAFDDNATQPIALAMTLSVSGADRLTLDTHPANGAGVSGEPAVMAFMRVMLGASPHSVGVGEQLVWNWRSADAAG